MNQSDHAPLIAIAMLAAKADGETDAAEQAAVHEAVERIGNPDISRLAKQVSDGTLRVADVAGRLSGEEARRAAYTTALAVCHADGAANAAEKQFLDHLQDALGLESAAVAELDKTAGGLSAAAGKGAVVAEAGAAGAGSAGTGASGAGDAALEDFILDQAILTGALEILPDHLANIAILPLQLRMVHEIGQRHGQKMDLAQVKDLAATLGLASAAQAVEGVAIKLLGGVAGGLLGGLIGGAARVATGAAITFAATYALGHVADQYYAQGRKLSAEDLRTQFARFQQEAHTIYPRVEEAIHDRAGKLDLRSLTRSLGARTS
jgi:uncharacterized membrane protein YebE (DUF533 family)